MSSLGQSMDLIRVAVVTDSPSAARDVTRALRESGYAVRPYTLSSNSAFDRVRELRPGVVVLRVGSVAEFEGSAFKRVSAYGGPAVVLLTPGASAENLEMAQESGALVHLVEPVTTQALAAAVWLAAARAQDLRQLSQQLGEMRESLEARKAVERAKAILMRRLALTEEEAHRRLQKESRSRNRKLAETAWHVIKADGELPRVGEEKPARAAEASPAAAAGEQVEVLIP